jgi:hypothetical protein
MGDARAEATAMVTGAQIREARQLLQLNPLRLARRAKVAVSVIGRAERTDGERAITTEQIRAVQHALEDAGVEFTNGDQPGVRLKRANP